MNAPHATGLAVPPLSRRAESLGTENAFVVLAEVNALVRQGADIVSFCIGQPDFPTPHNIQDAAIAAIRNGRHGYTPSAGIDELRAAAAHDLGQRRGIDIKPDDVVVGAGAKPFIAYTIASVTDYGAGDEVIYPVPGFPIYESQIVANGAVPVPIFLREARDFAFDPAELKVKAGTRFILVITNKDDITHEIDIPKLRLEKKVRAGQVLRLQIPALKPGKYELEDDDSTPELHGTMIAE